jgi:hypothetical protein
MLNATAGASEIQSRSFVVRCSLLPAVRGQTGKIPSTTQIAFGKSGQHAERALSLALLRGRGERPSRATEEADELVPLHEAIALGLSTTF